MTAHLTPPQTDGPMRILGIDPGLRLTGYASIDVVQGQPRLREAGVLRLTATAPLATRLHQLHRDLDELIDAESPTHLVVEQIFSHARFVRTAITMGHARGVILLAAATHGLIVGELAPAEVKKSISGSGRATKAQVQHAVAAQLGLAEPPSPPDVADAIAIAICAAGRLSQTCQAVARVNPVSTG